jgi:dephospho-CoA kinase
VLRVGLTGGIGSGKSAVSLRLGARGAVVIDADLLAREVVAPGTAGLADIVVAFGPDMLDPEGGLNRTAMGARVFGDDAARAKLEAIIHPRVRQRAREIEAAAGADAIVVHDIPLLVETGQARDFDVVIVVESPADVQLERLTGPRGLTVEDATARIAAQATPEQRREVADHVIRNDSSFEDLDTQVEAVWRQLERLARSGESAASPR